MADLRWNPLAQTSFGDANNMFRLGMEYADKASKQFIDTSNTFMDNAQANNHAKVQQFIDSLPVDKLVGQSPAILQQAKEIAGNSFAGIDEGKLNTYLNARPTIVNAQTRDSNNTNRDSNDTIYKTLKINDDIDTLSANRAAEALDYASYMDSLKSPTLSKYANTIRQDILGKVVKNPVVGSRANAKESGLTLGKITVDNNTTEAVQKADTLVVDNAFDTYKNGTQAVDQLNFLASTATTDEEKKAFLARASTMQTQLNTNLINMGVNPKHLQTLASKYASYLTNEKNEAQKYKEREANIAAKNADANYQNTKATTIVADSNANTAQTASNIASNEVKVLNDTAQTIHNISSGSTNTPQNVATNKYLADNNYGNALSKDSNGNVALNTAQLNSAFSTNINKIKEVDLQERSAQATKDMLDLTTKINKNSYAQGDDLGGGTRQAKLQKWIHNDLQERIGRPVRADEEYKLLSALNNGTLKFNDNWVIGDDDNLDHNATKIFNDYSKQVTKDSNTKVKLKYDEAVTNLANKLGISKADVAILAGHMSMPSMVGIIPDDIKNSIMASQAKKLVKQGNPNPPKTKTKVPEVLKPKAKQAINIGGLSMGESLPMLMP